MIFHADGITVIRETDSCGVWPKGRASFRLRVCGLPYGIGIVHECFGMGAECVEGVACSVEA